MALVKFITGTYEQYKALASKDSNALYFLSNGQLYKGDLHLSDQVIVTDSLPVTGEVGKIYINTSNNTVNYCGASGYVSMMPSTITAITGAEDDSTIPTTKAVIDYVQGKLDEIPDAVDYTVTISTKETPTEGYAKTYEIKQLDGVIGTIDIPKDMVVSSGTVTENGEGVKVIQLTLNNGDVIEIPVADLVDIYTAEQSATQVQLAINDSNEISASIVAGSITKTELASDIVTSLGKADSAVQSVVSGATNGTISVDGTEVSVAGLKGAAFVDLSELEAAGAAAQALTDAKAYTDTALTWSAIE